MLLQIKRPVRPEPRPLSEWSAADPAARPARIWLTVRHKRQRPPATPRRRPSPRPRGPASSPRP